MARRSPASTARLHGMHRRDFLRSMFLTAGAVGSPAWLASCTSANGGLGTGRMPNAGGAGRFANIGPLREADANGVRTPEGFSTRVVAINNELPQPNGMSAILPQTGGVGNRPWHILNDGGGIFPRDNGGWIYVSNSEVPGFGNLAQIDDRLAVLGNLVDSFAPGLGGCGTLVFDPDGTIVDSYSILTGTTFNCAGGVTPWGTWLSCEEYPDGRVWECDPYTPGEGVPLPALGFFDHEAVFVDTRLRVIYQTEDKPDGRFFRFVPDAADWPQGAERAALQAGRLQALVVEGDGVEGALTAPQPTRWKDVLNPGEPQLDNRDPETTAFDGGEGLWMFNDIAYFSTKNDERIWAYDTRAETIEVIYDLATAQAPNNILSGVDNITITDQGDVLVAEDGGDMQVVVILPDRSLIPLLQIVGQDPSEIAGIAFTPDGRRMYFTSDRGGRNGLGGYGVGAGMLYELTLPEGI